MILFSPTVTDVRVRTVGAWFDVHDNDWANVTAGLLRGLQQAGAYAGHVNAVPPAALFRLVGGWLRLTGRLDLDRHAWLFTPEISALNRATNLARRTLARPDGSVWLQLGPYYGRPTRGPLVTLTDCTMPQFDAMLAAPGVPEAEPTDRKWRRLRRATTELYHRAAACFAASSWAARSLVEDFRVPAAKVHVIGYGRNLDVPETAGRDWSVPRFLFVGRDWQRKNGDAVVRAFLRLRQCQPGAHLDLVGSHPRVDVDGVTGHGPIRADEAEGRQRLGRIFGQATCFVMPSFVEPFGIAYVEAMAAGMPVIASSVGGASDFVDDGVGRLVDPRQQQALLEAMRWCSTPPRAALLGQQARIRAGAYTWEAVAQRMLAVLGRLGTPPGGRRGGPASRTPPTPVGG